MVVGQLNNSVNPIPKFFGVASLLAGRSASKLAGYAEEFSN
jgi:hypothetical protein